MALTWKIDKVNNWKEISEGNAWTVTDMLIWATMFTGICKITADNAKEFYTRIHFLEHLNGTFLRGGDGEQIYISLEDVTRRIGLSTNAGTLTRPQFLKLKAEYFWEQTAREEPHK